MSDRHAMPCSVCEATAVGNLAGAWYCTTCLAVAIDWSPDVLALRVRALPDGSHDWCVLSNAANWLAAVRTP